MATFIAGILNVRKNQNDSWKKDKAMRLFMPLGPCAGDGDGVEELPEESAKALANGRDILNKVKSHNHLLEV